MTGGKHQNDWRWTRFKNYFYILYDMRIYLFVCVLAEEYVHACAHTKHTCKQHQLHILLKHIQFYITQEIVVI